MKSIRLDTVLIVDDDTNSSWFHQMLIQKYNLAEEVKIKADGQIALNYLLKLSKNKQPLPDLIFLDINMPVMNGWEFLQAIEFHPQLDFTRTKLFILTTSLNPDDKLRVEEFPIVSGFLTKYLTVNQVNQLIHHHFNLFKAH